MQRRVKMDGRVTGGGKGIPYLRDYFEPEMSAAASERLTTVPSPEADSEQSR